MTDPRDQQRLAGVHPYLGRRVLRVLDAMRVLGFPMFIVSGVRSDVEQQRLYAQGRTSPGAIVTHIDGVRKKSMHQRQTTGYGHAVDLAFVDDVATPKVETWDPKQPWSVYGEMAEAFGLTWGGRWKTLIDLPHCELSLSSPHAADTGPS